MTNAGIALLAAATLAIAPAFAAKRARGNDYPTLDRVQYVEECIQSHPDRQRQEMVYKCSCALDEIAKRVPYRSYVELSTSVKASGIAGERGALREDPGVKSMVKKFREVQGQAYKICLISQD
jgi:hypothetical protein